MAGPEHIPAPLPAVIASGSMALPALHAPAHATVRYWWLALAAAPHALQRQQVRAAVRHLLQVDVPAAALPPPFVNWAYAGHHALLAAAETATIGIGVDASAAALLDLPGWHAVLRLYGGPGALPPTADEAARRWAAIEAAAKCRRTGLREWTPHQKTPLDADCTLQTLPTPEPGWVAALAWSHT